MYKVFINDLVFILAGPDAPFFPGNGVLHIRFDESMPMESLIVLAEENHPTLTAIQVMYDDADMLFDIFSSYYKVHEAAGGLVRNSKGETLVIFRRGKWDLPKGKLDKGETPEQAALREVEEECGISGMEIVKPLPSTWHTFMQDHRRILKRTWWFEMKYTGDQDPVPQQEEDIEKAIWADAAQMKTCAENTYRSLVHFF
ncbi:MAG: ADP-ribose pyrophosphatase [Bacteroidetes bacterium]|nr:MAG: ADP-ribose pyrophosphatase [Bacteroidota bacterium]